MLDGGERDSRKQLLLLKHKRRAKNDASSTYIQAWEFLVKKQKRGAVQNFTAPRSSETKGIPPSFEGRCIAATVSES
jgi:hypothetical protein